VPVFGPLYLGEGLYLGMGLYLGPPSPAALRLYARLRPLQTG
jgi:hypothetical protein